MELLPPKIFKPESASYAESVSPFHNSGHFSTKPSAFTISGGNRLFAMVLRPMIKLKRALFAKYLEYLPGGKATIMRLLGNRDLIEAITGTKSLSADMRYAAS